MVKNLHGDPERSQRVVFVHNLRVIRLRRVTIHRRRLARLSGANATMVN